MENNGKMEDNLKLRKTANSAQPKWIAPVSSAPPKSTNKWKNRLGDLKQFMYDRRRRTVMGRTGKQWLLIGLFYLVFYGILFGALIGALFFVKVNMSMDSPTVYGPESILKKPVLLVKAPPYYVRNAEIRYNDSVDKMVDDILAINPLLWQNISCWQMVNRTCSEPVKNMTILYRDTGAEDPKRKDCCVKDKAGAIGYGCELRWRFEEEYGNCSCPNMDSNCSFGYDTKQPCVAVFITKVMGWKPHSLLAEFEELGCCVFRFKLTCIDDPEAKVKDPLYPYDNETYPINVFPEDGLPICYFPFQGQKIFPNFVHPLFMVQPQLIDDITRNITCMISDKYLNSTKDHLNHITINITVNPIKNPIAPKILPFK